MSREEREEAELADMKKVRQQNLFRSAWRVVVMGTRRVVERWWSALRDVAFVWQWVRAVLGVSAEERCVSCRSASCKVQAR